MNILPGSSQESHCRGDQVQKLHFPDVIPESFATDLTAIGSSECQDQPEPVHRFKFRVMDVAGGTFRAGHSLLKGNGDGTTRGTKGTKDCLLCPLCLSWFLSFTSARIRERPGRCREELFARACGRPPV